MGNILLDKEHGLAPIMKQCFVCGEASEIILAGRAWRNFASPGATKPPRQVATDKEPCQKCQEYMKAGVILISVRDGENGDNPYRTGAWVVIKERLILEVFGEDHLILKRRIGFVEDALWDRLGLPRKEMAA